MPLDTEHEPVGAAQLHRLDHAVGGGQDHIKGAGNVGYRLTVAGVDLKLVRTAVEHRPPPSPDFRTACARWSLGSDT